METALYCTILLQIPSFQRKVVTWKQTNKQKSLATHRKKKQLADTALTETWEAQF